MNRPLGSLLLALPMATTLMLGAAHANDRAGPMESLMGLFQHEAQAQPVDANRVSSEALPPPGFATPNGAPPAVVGPTGHQFGDQSPPQGAPMAPGLAAAPAGTPDGIRPPAGIGGPSASPRPLPANAVMTLPPDDQPEQGQPKELPPNLRKQLVDYATKEPAGTIVVDTANTYLYLVLGNGKALRYGVRVGREGFTWTGTERISRMKEWPDWHPPAEMIERQPYLPRFMAGGDGNPLGARAMYLGTTLYRIHGTNQPSTIGHYVSSGCVGMLNDDVEDLFSRVQVGTRVVVLPGKPAPENVAAGPQPPANPMAPPSAVPGAQRAPSNMPPAGNNGQGGIVGASLPPAR